jgi:hypothetical protein
VVFTSLCIFNSQRSVVLDFLIAKGIAPKSALLNHRLTKREFTPRLSDPRYFSTNNIRETKGKRKVPEVVPCGRPANVGSSNRSQAYVERLDDLRGSKRLKTDIPPKGEIRSTIFASGSSRIKIEDLIERRPEGGVWDK